MLECVAPKAVLFQRLRARETAGPQESDARSELLEEFQKNFEPIRELAGKEHLRIDSTATDEVMTRSLREALDRFSSDLVVDRS
jgi:predicted kinase